MVADRAGPVTHGDHATPVAPTPSAPPPPPPGPAGTYAAPTAVAAPPAAPQKRSGCLTAALIVAIIAALLVVIGVVAAVFLADSDGNEAAETQAIESADDEASPGSSSPVTATDAVEALGAADEIDDVRSCSWSEDEVLIELVNNSSKTSSHTITPAYLDEDGSSVGDELHLVSAVRPSEQVQERLVAFEEPTAGCEIIDVERFAGESAAQELAEIGACEVGPPDFVDDATATRVATNSSSKISDYLIEAAFLNEAGVRTGT